MSETKDFDKWNREKKKLHFEKQRPFFDTREVWFAHLGVNVGYEQDGSGQDSLRPVVILKKFNNEVCWVLPFTKSKKEGKYYFKISLRGSEESRVILSQIKLLDVKRLKYKVGDVNKTEFAELKKRLRDFLS